MHLDHFLPAYDFREFHAVSVRAPATGIFRAIKVLNRAELAMMRLLLAIRSLPARTLGEGTTELAGESVVAHCRYACELRSGSDDSSVCFTIA